MSQTRLSVFGQQCIYLLINRPRDLFPLFSGICCSRTSRSRPTRGGVRGFVKRYYQSLVKVDGRIRFMLFFSVTKERTSKTPPQKCFWRTRLVTIKTDITRVEGSTWCVPWFVPNTLGTRTEYYWEPPVKGVVKVGPVRTDRENLCPSTE